MNFTPFTSPFTGSIPVHLSTAKFANTAGQATTMGPGTVVALSGADGGLYIRPQDLQGNQTLITVPVSMGKYTTARLADVQTTQAQNHQQTAVTSVQAQTLQPGTVQVINHGGIKYNVTPVFQQMSTPMGATVLTVAYPDLDGSGDGKQQMQSFPIEIGQDLCATLVIAQPTTVSAAPSTSGEEDKKNIIQIKREDGDKSETTEIDFQQGTATLPQTWQSVAAPGTAVADFMARIPSASLPLSLHHFLKFTTPDSKKEEQQCTVTLPPATQPIVITQQEVEQESTEQTEETTTAKGKKKKKPKKPVTKQPRMRPGQVQLTTALDGTTLFCCPECNMAYPDKDLLEQHLVAHKIERRFICDICGAGLKRKEHLDRHKQGHNPERPFICSVCMKGFKRKEHLNLHFVIHSGEKTHICPECGKGFYRKDHLRKHSRSHLAKRVKSEQQQHQQQQIKIDIVQQAVENSEANTDDDPLKLI